MRVFLDTNVLVSAVATRGICADIVQAVLVGHRLIVGETVLDELQRVLREKLGLSAEIVEETLDLLRREAIVVDERPSLQLTLRDPDDIAVLAEAVAGKVDVLVTGDRDLLEVAASHLPVRVVSPRSFWELMRSKEGVRPAF